MNLEITRPLLKVAGLTPLLCCLAIAQPGARPDVLSMNAIVQGMEEAQYRLRVQPRPPYQVIREYRLFGAKSSSVNAEVVAQLDFRPPTGRDYNIQKWSGSARGKQVVQRVLDHEVEENEGDYARRAITTDNYDFILVGETLREGRPCYVVGLKPKRKERDLISGEAWVEKSSLSILHIEGESARPPSWWLKSVRVKLSFGDLSGSWLQTSMEAVADVRFLGSHTLTSRILDYRGTDLSAATTLAPTRIQTPSPASGH